MAMNFSKDSSKKQVVFLLSSAGKTEDSMWENEQQPQSFSQYKNQLRGWQDDLVCKGAFRGRLKIWVQPPSGEKKLIP